MVGRDCRGVSGATAQAARGAHRALSDRDHRRRSVPRLRGCERGRRDHRRGSPGASGHQAAQARDRAAAARALPRDGSTSTRRAGRCAGAALQRRVLGAAGVRLPRANFVRVGCGRSAARLAGARRTVQVASRVAGITRSSAKSIAVTLVMAVAVVYASLCAVLFFTQASLLYHPTIEANSADAEVLRLQAEDASLKIWHVARPGERALIYFGGNGDDAAAFIKDFAQWFPDRSLYLANYRGYGGSGG